MPDPDVQVLAIGNAIVDVLVSADEALLARHGVSKGEMRLIDAEGAERLYADMPPGVEQSGGSAANTVAGVASLGGRSAFIGKVRDDQMGEVFTHDIKAVGVEFDTPAATSGPPSGRCLILVTDDAERTLNTFLGAANELAPDDVDPALVERSQVTYLEGYLWDPPLAKDAFRKAMAIATEAGNKVAFTLSDAFCVDRHRAEFIDLVDHHVDILFANEHELVSLYQADHFDDAVRQLRGRCEVAAITRGEKGSIVVSGHEVHAIDARLLDGLVDTTGAGDQYAAGFLYGLTSGFDLERCGRLASLCAAEVISHVGGRPATSLRELAEKDGLLP